MKKNKKLPLIIGGVLGAIVLTLALTFGSSKQFQGNLQGIKRITITANSAVDVNTNGGVVLQQTSMKPLLRFAFTGDANENWYVDKLQLSNTGSQKDVDLTKVYIEYVDSSNTPYTASANLVNGKVNFTLPQDHRILIPKNQTSIVRVLGDIGEISSGVASTGDLIQLNLDSTGFSATSESGNKSSLTKNVVGAEFRLVNGYPTITDNNSTISQDLVNGNNVLFKWTIGSTNFNQTGVSLKQMAFKVTSTTGINLSNFKLLKNGVDISTNSENVDIVNQTGANIENTTVISGDSTIYIQWRDERNSGEEVIQNGQQQTYQLQATIFGSTGAPDQKVTIALLNDTSKKTGKPGLSGGKLTVDGTVSNLIWSDYSSLQHSSSISADASSDWLDGYLVPGLSTLSKNTLY